MNSDAKRLYKCAFLERYMFWQFEAALFGQAIERRQCAVVWRSGGKTHRAAQVVTACPTGFAGIAAYSWLQGDSVTNAKVLDIIPNRFDDAGGFVAKDDWAFHNVWPDVAMLPIMYLQLVQPVLSRLLQ